MESWIKLYRSILENGMLKNHKFLVLWIYLLLRANYKAGKVRLPVKRNSGMTVVEVQLLPGQLIFGRIKASKDTGMSQQNVRTIMKQLEKLGSIKIEPTNSHSIVTVVNWPYYQDQKKSPTTNSPPLDHELTIYNNGNNGNNAAAEDNPLHQFTTELKELFIKRNIPIKEIEFSLWVRKLFKKYGREALENVFTGVLKSIDEGKPIENPIAYGAKILKEEFPEIGSGAKLSEEETPTNEP